MFNAKIIVLALCMLITGKLGSVGLLEMHLMVELLIAAGCSYISLQYTSHVLCSCRHSQHYHYQIPGKKATHACTSA